MCILSLFQGHSDSCECDKCQEPEQLTAPETPTVHEFHQVTLTEIVEETETNQAEMMECLKALHTTVGLLEEVMSEAQDLRTMVKVTPASGPVQGNFQPVSPECIMTTLCGTLPYFKFHLQPLVPVQTSHWKSSRFSLRFAVLTFDNQALSRKLVFQLAAYRAIAPPTLITGGIRAKTFLRGQCLQSSVDGTVVFDKLSFAEVSSNIPGKTVLLVVVCKNEEGVQPYVSPPIKVISRY